MEFELRAVPVSGVQLFHGRLAEGHCRSYDLLRHSTDNVCFPDAIVFQLVSFFLSH